MAQIIVTPVVSLADEPVKICVFGLKPTQLVTIQASVTDERGILFHSRAFYRADSSGEVDLERTAASGGDFQGVLPMGLFWSLRSVKPFQRLIKRDVMGSPFRVTLDVYDFLLFKTDPAAQPVASQVTERWFVKPGIERTKIREGRVRGALFLPPGEGPFPGVIDMFGGIGGLVEFRSGLLASHGFASLALPYFGYEDLPRTLTEVDLEYFEEAANLLLKHPKVLGPGIGVIGVSKGAEIALAMATFLKHVKATVFINGFNSMNGTPLHYRDIHIPGIPYYEERILLSDSGAIDTCYVFGDPLSPKYQDCVLPIEKAVGHILFVIGGEDRSCNSKRNAEEAIERLRHHGRNNSQLLFYPGAGHLIEPPASPFVRVTVSPGVLQPLIWGGELVAHSKAQEHSWLEIQRFLRLHLGKPSMSRL
ncbi:acyl-coenzyme A amino acid N-acyltransferase 1-like [Ambystoma mexicanum]|uniref:acyl-coenzyme A amino acid N-acyltransferase 1-like n=1 Tax=Ambystoma mexicanum TaxID=8296 RepID=UPI0037E971DC